MNENDIIPHYFKTEFSKMVSVLTKSFGLEYIEIAEDIVSETFLAALDSWPYRGRPANPTAWLYTVAKNKMKNHLARHKNYAHKVSTLSTSFDLSNDMEIDFSEKNITDSQLQMLFAVCHPSITPKAQICLALRVLGGLGLSEIADAFLSNKESIHKTLQRAKAKLNTANIKMEMPNDADINHRLGTVTQAIYLLFSEGYYSESHQSIIRKELCVEALNLTYLLLSNPKTNNHATNALMSLMCFHSSRLEARQSINGSIVLYDDQDRNLWDTEFIEKGFYYLQQASKWKITSSYYIEASIAYWHTVENSHPDKWVSILKLYDVLILNNDSPIVALNRIWAFSKVHGNVSAIQQTENLRLTTNHFYYLLLANLNKSINIKTSIEYLIQAMHHCKTNKEKEMIQNQILELNSNLFLSLTNNF
jgi:RNA polymerase sigma-70 factor (ECF subfamily)